MKYYDLLKTLFTLGSITLGPPHLISLIRVSQKTTDPKVNKEERVVSDKRSREVKVGPESGGKPHVYFHGDVGTIPILPEVQTTPP